MIYNINRMTILLLFGLYTNGIMAQTSLPEKLSHVLEVKDMEEGIKLYNEIKDDDLPQLPDCSLFDYHYLGGWLNSEIPNHEKAIFHLLETKRLCETSLGIHSAVYMEIMDGLGDEYMEIEQYDKALEIYQEGIVKSMSVRNIASHTFGNLIIGVQKCYERKGWFNEIPTLLLDSWSFWSKDDKPFATYNYYPLWNLHQFYRRYEKYDKALQVSDSTLSFIAKKVGQEHPEMAHELYFRGNTLTQMGRNLDAVGVYKKALSILQLNKKDKDELYIQIGGNLLMSLISTDIWEEYNEVLKIIKDYSKKVNKPDKYKNALFSAASSFNKIGNYAKALELNTQLLGLDLSEEERASINNQTITIQKNKDLTEAVPQLEDLFKSVPIGSPEWLETGYKLSNAYYHEKEVGKNINILKTMYEAITKNLSIGANYHLWILNNLYGACFEKQKYENALNYATEKWSYISTIPEVPDEHLFYAKNDIIAAKLKSNHLDGINEDLEMAEKLCRKVFGIESKAYSIYLHNMGRAYQLQGNFNEAKQSYLMAIALQIKKNGTGTPINSTVQYLSEIEKQITDEDFDL